MNEILELMIKDSGFSLEKCFLYEGRLANYVSTLALRHMLRSSDLQQQLGTDLTGELDKIECNIDNLTVIKYLHLKEIVFRYVAGAVYRILGSLKG